MNPIRTRAFTLIEMLVTLAIFGMLMVALTGGLFTGTRAWSRADENLVRSSALDVALDEWQSDFERPWLEIGENVPAFEAGADEKSRTRLKIRSLSAREENAPAGAVTEATWAAREIENGGLDWVRSVQDSVAGSAVGEPIEETILSGVSRVEYRYLIRGQWVEELDENSGIPSAVQARVTMTGTPQAIAWRTARVVIGEIKK